MKYIVFLIVVLNAGFSLADDKPRTMINFLPDGTEIKIENHIVYAMCNGKYVIAKDGTYELADGSELIVKKGHLFNKKKCKKWETHPEEEILTKDAKTPSP